VDLKFVFIFFIFLNKKVTNIKSMSRTGLKSILKLKLKSKSTLYDESSDLEKAEDYQSLNSNSRIINSWFDV
jgi:hypothetical protein